ncbi:CopM family metallochaperone [Aminobacter niigataensis]|uniref:Uncharacterized protein (DUF305 family) n=1 Tax=Aminobacter niigataensis TaxID=83265 RepID=A0ABR6L379_9HYPH|nr:DUF305 domain-containing protein [Aminobacter niigataensis]MBB4651247.1 uncharacterized protein (DUF305 family) [Aminobacter niigataensis]CAI2931717.1 conserved exported protein of unknown function [Aminobacter niigataensis]
MNLMKKIVLALMAAGMLVAVVLETASAQTDHGGHAMGMTAPATDSASAQAYKAAMDKMHQAMSALEYSGDADVDFARGMIPHHQAAIDMAKVVLEHGKNPEMRKLAEEVVAAQEAEIKQMEAWLAANPAK